MSKTLYEDDAVGLAVSEMFGGTDVGLCHQITQMRRPVTPDGNSWLVITPTQARWLGIRLSQLYSQSDAPAASFELSAIYWRDRCLLAEQGVTALSAMNAFLVNRAKPED